MITGIKNSTHDFKGKIARAAKIFSKNVEMNQKQISIMKHKEKNAKKKKRARDQGEDI